MPGLMVAGFGCGGLDLQLLGQEAGDGRSASSAFCCSAARSSVSRSFSIGLMPSWHWFVPAVIVLGMGYYTMHGTLQTRATELAPQARGTAISLFAFFFFLGQATGPQLLGSILKSRGYAAAFIVAGVGLFTTAFVSRALFARRAKLAS